MKKQISIVCQSLSVLLAAIIVGVWYVSVPRTIAFVAAQYAGYPAPQSYVETRYFYVETKENIFLQTAHFYPSGSNLSVPTYPTILIRTAYGITIDHGGLGLLYQVNAHYLSSFGYNIILQNVRGRYNSSGEWDPCVNEKTDGYETLKWIKKQKWFNGKIGTAGSSYVGYTQFSLFGSEAPLEISASVPTVTAPSFYGLVHQQDAPVLETTITWSNLLYMTSQNKDPEFLESVATFLTHKKKLETLTYSNISQVVPLIEADVKQISDEGDKLITFRGFLENKNVDDDYWVQRDRSAQLADVKTGSIHLVGSWHDIFLPFTLDTYSQLVKLGKKPYLTIYGGDHVELAHAFYGYSLNWYDHHLKGAKLERLSPVRLRINPNKEWLELDSWPPVSFASKFYFHHSGMISASEISANEKEIYKYTYDPENPTPTVGGYLLLNGGARDNQPFLSERLNQYKDIILFTSPVFQKDTVIIGKVIAKLYVSSSLANTDFYVRIFDYLASQNTSTNIADGFTRIHNRKEITNSVVEIEVELYPTSYKFQVGHSLQVMISSGAHPYISRNPGTGEHITTATKFLKADQQLFVSSDYPSHLILPVFKQ